VAVTYIYRRVKPASDARGRQNTLLLPQRKAGRGAPRGREQRAPLRPGREPRSRGLRQPVARRRRLSSLARGGCWA